MIDPNHVVKLGEQFDERHAADAQTITALEAKLREAQGKLWRVALPVITKALARDYSRVKLIERTEVGWVWTQDAVDFAALLQSTAALSACPPKGADHE